MRNNEGKTHWYSEKDIRRHSKKVSARSANCFGVGDQVVPAAAAALESSSDEDDDEGDDDDAYDEKEDSQVCTLCYGSLAAADSKVTRPGNRSAHSACDTIRRELLKGDIAELTSSAAYQWELSFCGQKSSKSATSPTTITKAPASAPLLQSQRELPKRSRVALAIFHEHLIAANTNTDAAVGVAGGISGGAAASVGVAEELLLRSGKLLADDAQKQEQLLRAIAVGELGVAGQFLLSHSIGCAAANAAAGTHSGQGGGADNFSGSRGTINCAVCYDSMASASSPGGLVSCLGGHALHAGCASELLLGGGACPECREPLFFAKLETHEIVTAAAAAAAAASDADAGSAPHMNEEGVAVVKSAFSGLYYCGRAGVKGLAPRRVTKVGQKVCLSKDYHENSDAIGGPLEIGDLGTVNKAPSNSRVQVRSKGGKTWYYDLAALRRVAAEVENGGSVPVCGPLEGRPCRACRRWNKALGLTKPTKVSKAAFLAKQQTAQLRAELAAVQASRAEAKEQLVKVLTTRRSKDAPRMVASSDLGSVDASRVDASRVSLLPPTGAQPVPSAPLPLQRRMSASSAETAAGLDESLGDADVQRGRR